MKSTKKKSFIEDETAFKTSEVLEGLKEEELGFRKILFKFVRQNSLDFEKADPHVFKRKFSRGYMGDLSNSYLIELTKKVISWKTARKEVCRECIIKTNCSETCLRIKKKFEENLHGLHQKK